MPKSRNKKIASFLMLAVNVVFLSFVVLWFKHNISEKLLVHDLYLVPAWLIVSVLCINVITMVFYGRRLAMILGDKFSVGFPVSAVGNAANNLLPFRLGEIFRVYFSKKKFNISIPESLTAILVERLSDLAAVFCLGVIVLAKTPIDIRKHTLMLFVLLAVAAVALTFLVYIMKSGGVIKNKLMNSAFFSKAAEQVTRLVRQKKIVPICLYTLLIWVFTVLAFFVFFKFSLPHAHLSLLDASALAFFTTLTLAFSSVPSSIGFFEAGIVFYLRAVLGVDQDLSLALALLFHIAVVLPQLGFALLFLVTKRRKQEKCLAS